MYDKRDEFGFNIVYIKRVDGDVPRYRHTVHVFTYQMTNMDNDHIPIYSTKSIIQKNHTPKAYTIKIIKDPKQTNKNDHHMKLFKLQTWE